jgi:hypothetical protein
VTEDRWTVEHFSQANPEGEGQESVPALLRRVADSIEELGAVNVQDVVCHVEMDSEGKDRPTMTVYFHRD